MKYNLYIEDPIHPDTTPKRCGSHDFAERVIAMYIDFAQRDQKVPFERYEFSQLNHRAKAPFGVFGYVERQRETWLSADGTREITFRLEVDF